MPRLLALEWDGNEARIAVGRTRGKIVALEHAFSVPLPSREAGMAPEAAIGKEIAAALAKRDWSRGEALVAVGRSSIELRFLSTPPAPPEEVADLVRFQAMRQFSTLGDNWPLDYVPLGSHADGGSNVLAAAIAPELVGQIQAICVAAGLECKQLVLRPFAAASLIKDRAGDGRCRMLVDVLSADADLTVLVGPQVVFPRTARLATGDDEFVSRALLAEVRRTIVAAQNQLGGRRVEQVIIFGDGEHQAALRSLMQKELGLEVELFDPLTAVDLTDEARKHRPEMASAFAPLVGMLVDAASEAAPAIDFLHPRRRPTPANNNRLYSWAGGTAAAVALVLVGLVWMQLRSLDNRISSLKAELIQQTKLAKQGKPVRDEVARLDQFAASDVFWLAELREIIRKFPGADKARVDELYGSSKGNAEAAQLTLQGVASDSKVISQIEQALRDERHVVVGSGGREDERAGALRWQFKEDIRISPDEGLAPPVPAPKANRPATAKASAAAKGAR